jgi:hypothetical protein
VPYDTRKAEFCALLPCAPLPMCSYIAPEVSEGGHVSQAGDVFSMGVVMLQVGARSLSLFWLCCICYFSPCHCRCLPVGLSVGMVVAVVAAAWLVAVTVGLS